MNQKKMVISQKQCSPAFCVLQFRQNCNLRRYDTISAIAKQLMQISYKFDSAKVGSEKHIKPIHPLIFLPFLSYYTFFFCQSLIMVMCGCCGGRQVHRYIRIQKRCVAISFVLTIFGTLSSFFLTGKTEIA